MQVGCRCIIYPSINVAKVCNASHTQWPSASVISTCARALAVAVGAMGRLVVMAFAARHWSKQLPLGGAVVYYLRRPAEGV